MFYGASPANLTMKLLDPGRVVSGVNLPMLLRALDLSGKGFEIPARSRYGRGRDGVLNLLKDV